MGLSEQDAPYPCAPAPNCVHTPLANSSGGAVMTPAPHVKSLNATTAIGCCAAASEALSTSSSIGAMALQPLRSGAARGDRMLRGGDRASRLSEEK